MKKTKAPSKKSAKILPIPKTQRTGTHWKELNKVIDPELNLGVVDLGLIYDIKIDKKGTANVYMTLTSPACPASGYLLHEVENRMRMFKDIKNVYIEIVWDPPWQRDMIDEDIRELLFGF